MCIRKVGLKIWFQIWPLRGLGIVGRRPQGAHIGPDYHGAQFRKDPDRSNGDTGNLGYRQSDLNLAGLLAG